jgi:pyruvate/2-oxoglutarate dehydrogenase complex dihydrolipoamide acyltransferase (E2) component
MLEMDVSASRDKIRQHKRKGRAISFTAWMIKVISTTIREHAQVAAYLQGTRKAVVFDHIHMSIAVEKEMHGQRAQIPLVIETADERSIESIANQIHEARNKELTEKDIVLHETSSRWERLYYVLPGFLRRSFWRYLLRHPRFAFRTMGNVAMTSIGMLGRADGWFIPISVHPICFGIGRITKKPVVVNDAIEIREMLKLTVLLDHDVADGGQMARFISNLTDNIERGREL